MHMCNDMRLNRASFRLLRIRPGCCDPGEVGRRLSTAASRVLSPLPVLGTVSRPVGRQSGAMKLVKASQDITIPDDVKLEVKSRKIRVTGPRGTLTRDFKHLAVDMYKTHDQVENDEGEMVEGPLKLRVDCHFGKRKRLAAIRTCTSHVQNMIKGVTKGFEYKMRLVYAHFPINANITEEGSCIEVRNFLGEKRVRIVNMLPGVKIVRSTNVKDELVISGSDIELVSKSAALINMSCHVKKKDIRKFLDGVYVSEKTTIVKDE